MITATVSYPVFWLLLSLWEYLEISTTDSKGWELISFILLPNAGFDLINVRFLPEAKYGDWSLYISNFFSMFITYIIPCVLLVLCAMIQTFILLTYKPPVIVPNPNMIETRRFSLIPRLKTNFLLLKCFFGHLNFEIINPSSYPVGSHVRWTWR